MSWQNPPSGDEGSAPVGQKSKRARCDDWCNPREGSEDGGCSSGADSAEDSHPQPPSGHLDASGWQQPPSGPEDIEPSDQEEEQQPPNGTAECHLDMGMVTLALGAQTDVAPGTKYSQDGSSPARIKQVLQQGCKCKLPCRKAMNQSALVQFCTEFHRNLLEI